MTNPYFKASSSAKPHLVRGPGGLKGEIWKLRQELEAAFDQVANGGGGDLVLFKGDGSPQSGNTFGKWSDLMNFLSPLQAMQSGLKPRVRFTAPFTLPSSGMPPTGWPMAQATWESTVANTGVISVTVPAGVSVDMLTGVSNGLGIICNPSVDGETFKFSQIPPGAGPQIFQAASGATITHNTSTKALIKTAGAMAQTYVVFAVFGCTWLTPFTGPIVQANGGDEEWWDGIVSSSSASQAVFRHTLVTGDFDAAGEYEWAAFATIGGTERRVSDPERFVVKTRPTPA